MSISLCKTQHFLWEVANRSFSQRHLPCSTFTMLYILGHRNFRLRIDTLCGFNHPALLKYLVNMTGCENY